MHYGGSLIQADDLWSLEKGLYRINYGGHPYPGTSGKTHLTDTTFPNTTSYYFWASSQPPFGYAHIGFTNIIETGGVIGATLWVPAEK
jgi:hypothetical protein